MSKLSYIQTIYFIGIGGIGMSALARYFHSKNVAVSGYDKSSTVLTRTLEASGIPIHYEERLDLIPENPDLVVYTPAIPATHIELVHYRQKGFPVVKRSDVLQMITEASFNICVAGTHGKTTVTTMIAHLLRHSGYGCNAFLGGIAANYQTNFWSNERNVVVVEADEYDRSFLKLVPDVAVITSMDPDHLDIYVTPKAVTDAFIEFSQKLKPDGCLISKYGMKGSAELHAAHQYHYDFANPLADVKAVNLRIVQGAYCFDAQHGNFMITDILLPMGGLHNIENAIAAITVAKYLGIEDDQIRAALANFKGVRRRFEYMVNLPNQVLIDDYAHHPEELRALITGVRSLFADKKMVLVFQPHLYSRTNDLSNEFAESLDLVDQVILLPIYPARELPMEGVTSYSILDKMQLAEKSVMEKEAMLEWVTANKPDLLVMAGAGDIDVLVQQVKQILTS